MNAVRSSGFRALTAVLAVLVLLVGSAVASGSVSAAALPYSSSVSAGSTVRVDIVASGVSDVAGVQFSLSYDPSVLSFTSLDVDPFFSDNGAVSVYSANTQPASPGSLQNVVLLRTSSTGVSGSGTIATVHFDAAASGNPDVRSLSLLVSDSAGDPVASGVSLDLTVTLPSLPGDMNDDRVVDLFDIVAAVSLMLSSSYDTRADLNGDGTISVFDFVLIASRIGSGSSANGSGDSSSGDSGAGGDGGEAGEGSGEGSGETGGSEGEGSGEGSEGSGESSEGEGEGFGDGFGEGSEGGFGEGSDEGEGSGGEGSGDGSEGGSGETGGSGDTTPPSVSVSHLPFSPTIADTVTVTASASDASGLSAVRVYVDGSLVRTCTSSPCSHSSTYSSGSHTYRAEAVDASSSANAASTSTRSFTVSTSSSPPPSSGSDECASPHPDWILCDGFESYALGNPPPSSSSPTGWAWLPTWNVVTKANEIVSSPSPVFSGSQSLHIPYQKSGGSRDQNRFVQTYVSSHGLTHWFLRGYVYFAPGNGPEADQKKLYYLWGSNNQWHIVLAAWKKNGGQVGTEPLLLKVHWTEDRATTPKRVAGTGTIVDYGRWYSIEWEIKLNSNPNCTAGVDCDGETRVYLDGVQVLERTGMQIRTGNAPLDKVRVGNQANDGGNWYDEHRFWDNVILSRSYIGPAP